MKYINKIVFIALVFSIAVIGSCKKQAKCGCEGDIINSFRKISVYVTYNEENNWAEFIYSNAPYSKYYFCNPTTMMPELKKFSSGERVLITCDLYWDCNYVSQSSNSSYGSLYKAYRANVIEIESAIYGNN